MSDDFFESYALAMRAGEPGACAVDQTGSLPYHVLDAEAVEVLRASGPGGGLTTCENCGRYIFVPGARDRGLLVRGIDAAKAKLKGVTL